ncbi:hypothetical protein [Roseobacter weihaiensis]|uniref:hypothetical protein n=1 Tax=Roseobacter weihaiensis TaxID=2763262 RepID=UPI001D0A1598|nr:hypothetical protein [Roseobacter sp. H9]
MTDLTCRLYIDYWDEFEALAESATELLAGTRSGRSIIASAMELDLEVSLDVNPGRQNEEDGFLFYPYGAFIEPNGTAKPDKHISDLSQLVIGLRGKGAKVVASCDFEDEIARLTGWNWSERTPIHPKV